MTPRRSTPPLWFLVCVAAACALALRAVNLSYVAPHVASGHAPDVLYGFLAFIIGLGSLIFKGLQVAAHVTLEVLKWVVANLSLVVTKIANGLKTLGAGVLVGLHKAWDFFRLTYDRVIKPAVLKFWGWFDKARLWLDRTFRPILDWLKMVRDNLIGFYHTWVRPWLDIIDVTRRGLRIFAALGLDWARKLDAKLGQIEEKIDRPFRYVLGKINEVINIVNRVVTADGLFQRVALLRSLARDYQYAWNQFHSVFDRAITDPEKVAIDEKNKLPTFTENLQAFEQYLSQGTGPDAPLIDELALDLLLELRRR